MIAASNSTEAAAAAMTASSSPPSSPARPTRLVSPCRACFSDLVAVFVVLVCFSCVALCLHYAARVLLRCLDRRRAAGSREPRKPDSDSAGSAGESPVVAGAWAEAECAICLSELELALDDLDLEEGGAGERVRVRVLPACGHGFHAACVEAWLATRASCPTCRAPSRSVSRARPSRTTRTLPQPNQAA